MITTLTIEGFKCFNNVSIEMKPLTLFAGQNSAGKSSAIQAILALHQDNSNPFSGRFINIGKAEELYNYRTGKESIIISADYSDSNGKKVACLKCEGLPSTLKDQKKLEQNIIYCSANRIGARDVYKKPGRDNFADSNCEYSFAYFEKHKNDRYEPDSCYVYDKGESQLKFEGQVNYWLKRILGYSISSKEIDRTDLIQVSFIDEKFKNEMRPTNVGTGVTYISEIIISGFSCKKDDLLIIENPEIHLHPAAQAAFLEFISFLISCGIQVLIETHSDHIYNGVRRCIHDDYLSLEEVAVYFFKQDDKYCSEPVRIPINEKGQATKNESGMFDQIKKDLDIILEW